ncbi:hypothetical protein COU79_03450 [Candidatus Peregrinibacteria bacterium CG10_big_fil_rev_8_21_14_0_10_54_7]|nr:MAG: hypothetical protein COU79_03450 [Candidatus Peregrinibacteria bacterium CG10_big_fil_rev_8_21_14_0_10_54_7]
MTLLKVRGITPATGTFDEPTIREHEFLHVVDTNTILFQSLLYPPEENFVNERRMSPFNPITLVMHLTDVELACENNVHGGLTDGY